MAKEQRNIGIIAHVDAGKTTTTERILYYGGAKHRSGDVDEGNTTTDFDPLEKAKGITITSAAVAVEWEDTQITLIDTPGHVDFTAEVERSLRVLDGAVGVFCAVGGVEVQSETVWFQANRHRVPRIAFINKQDRTGADFENCIDEMKDRLGIVPAICTIPAGQGAEFTGVIDVIRMKFWKQDKTDEARFRYTWEDIPEEHQDFAMNYREMLLDAASQLDDELVEYVLEGKDVPEEMIRRALRLGTLSGQLTPIFCGSAKEFHGIRLLLEGVVDYLPSPTERPSVKGMTPKDREPAERRPTKEDPFAALAFKTVAERHGDLIFLRIYSGELRPGEVIHNATTQKSERISHLYRLMGDHRERLEVAGPGEIVAAVGLKNVSTGTTLCDQKNRIVLEEIRFPKPVISQALIPSKSVDESKLADALGRMVRDDPTLKCHTDEETNQIILSGMGELHLEVAVTKLERDFKLQVEVGRPMVAYRQTLAREIEIETRYIKQSGGRGKYAVISMKFEPLSPDDIAKLTEELEEANKQTDPNNLYFTDTIVGGVVPTEYIPSVEAGYRDACVKGAKYGFQCVDMRATLFDGKYHDVDSSQDAFRSAAGECTRDAQINAGIVLLEPIMKVVIHAPGEYQGDLARDVSRRRGIIQDLSMDDSRGQARCEVHAEIPLAELFGYISDLNNFTSGTASFVMEPSHYAPVKEELANLPEKK